MVTGELTTNHESTNCSSEGIYFTAKFCAKVFFKSWYEQAVSKSEFSLTMCVFIFGIHIYFFLNHLYSAR